MFTVEAQVTIGRPVGEVYHFLLDPANYSRWIADVKAVQATAPLRVGQTFEEVTLFQGQEKRSVGQVVEARTNACLVLRITKVRSGPQLLPTRTFTLASMAGGTQLVWRSEVHTSGLMRLLQPLLPSVFRRKKATYLAALKTLLEQVDTTSGVQTVASAPPTEPKYDSAREDTRPC